jgi:hypothetical protein
MFMFMSCSELSVSWEAVILSNTKTPCGHNHHTWWHGGLQATYYSHNTTYMYMLHLPALTKLKPLHALLKRYDGNACCVNAGHHNAYPQHIGELF